MATYSLFGLHFLLSCFMLLVLAAVQGEEDYEKCSSEEPKCRLQISGCEDKNAVKKIKLGDNHWYGIDTIVNIPESKYSSIFIHKNGVFPSETLKPPTSFSINNNITFHICTLHPINQTMSLFTSCSSYNIYYNSSSDHPLPMLFLPVGCLPTRFLHIPTTPSCTIFFSLLEIRVELPPSCKQCSPPQCQVNLQGQYPTCSPPNPPPAKPKAKKIGLYVGIPCSVAVVALIVLLLYRQRNKYSGLKNQPRSASSSSFRESGAVYFGIPIFSYEELRKATYNFDQAMELGEGGFGTVYYGKLRDGREVAVKRLFERNYRPVEPFTNEIKILTRLKHRNLVSLYGCTSRHSRELLLVYEYIPNGTVSSHLHGDQATLRSLPWPLRMKIAIETASALAYLHASDIIHRDVKTSNILLDNDFGVKVADFGLSRLFPDDATHVSTVPRGTPGYVDPEYRLCYQLTTKSDVYSFGVVLVELISSLKAIDMNRSREDIKLANLAIRKIQKGAFCELVDPFLDFQSDEKLKSMIVSVAELAFQCLQGDKELRPSMGEVLEVLQRIQNGRDEPGNLEGIVVHGPTRASQSLAHSPLPNTLKMPQPRLHHTH